jgi:HPt (histidine-containing phosphotransfer) domain-containing protein
MNGYIAKPLRPAPLEQAIEQWTGGTLAPAAVAPLPEPTRNDAAMAFDREDFVERLLGNQDLARRLVRGFVDDMPEQIARLAQAVSNLDAETVRLVAHSIKGAAASVCGLEMQEIAHRLEQNGRAGDLAAASAALPELSASLDRARPIMQKFGRDDLAGR